MNSGSSTGVYDAYKEVSDSRAPARSRIEEESTSKKVGKKVHVLSFWIWTDFGRNRFGFGFGFGRIIFLQMEHHTGRPGR